MAQLETILHGESPQIVGTATGKVTIDQMIYTINLNGNISKAAFVFSYGTGDAISLICLLILILHHMGLMRFLC